LLYGMAGPIKRALVEMGYRVREYSPVGELLPGMSYLVRRLLENTSNEGFLRAKFSDHVSEAQLLRDPRESVDGAVAAVTAAREDFAGDTPASTDVGDFWRHLQECLAGKLRLS
jgi:RHH-type proline utilization regulon transcriptional repressor/proline dehydrogenase/delta 1-pyrroline-5-carboxylate dehydrogenase